MKKIFVLFCLISVCCFSCKKDKIEVDINNCSTAFSTQGLTLFTFSPFTTEELNDYDERVRRRQIPNDFLKRMSTHELFVQFIHMDMAKDVVLFNTMQQGFRGAIERFNMLQELYEHDDVAHYFTKTLSEVDIKEMKENECRFYYLCLQMLSAQKEVIGKMNKSQTINYINTLSQITREIAELSLKDPNWQSLSSYDFIMIGYGNIMIKYEYQPFMELMQSNGNVRSFMDGFIPLGKELIGLFENCMITFYEQFNS